MINAVSFKGAQPVTEKKESKKTTYAVPGLVLGTAAGAGTAAFTSLGKKAEFENVDAFVKSDKMAETLKSVTAEDKKDDVDILTKEKEVIEAKTKDVDTKLEAIFGKEAQEDAQVEISKVLESEKTTFDEVKKTVIDKADEPLTAKETDLKSIEAEVAKFEKGKAGEAIVGEKTVGNTVYKVTQEAGENKPVMIQKVIIEKNTAEGAKDTDVVFKAIDGEAAKELKAHSDAIAAERKTFSANKALADKLGITKDTKDATGKIKKSAIRSYFEESAKTISDEATKAFGNIQELLPKHVSNKAVAMYAAAGAAVGGLIGYMMKKKEA